MLPLDLIEQCLLQPLETEMAPRASSPSAIRPRPRTPTMPERSVSLWVWWDPLCVASLLAAARGPGDRTLSGHWCVSGLLCSTRLRSGKGYIAGRPELSDACAGPLDPRLTRKRRVCES